MQKGDKENGADLAPYFVAHPINRAAKLIGLSRSTIYELIKAGELDTCKSGKRTTIPHDSLVAFVERHRQRGKAARTRKRRRPDHD